MKILFTYKYDDEKMRSVRELGYEVDFIPEREVKNYDDFENIEILVCYNPFKYVDLRKFVNLKLILLSSIGIDQLPKDIVKENNIVVCNNRGGYSIPMGEWIVMTSLELLKNSKDRFESQRNKTWFMDTSVLEMYNKNIVFFGTGTIAKEAVKRLSGFGVNITGLNTDGRLIDGFNKCAPISDAKKYVSEADIIVIALPSTKKTIGIFDSKLIDSMKSTASIINIARGEIIDEEYLYLALLNKKIKSASLDVFTNEPLDNENKLWKLRNVNISSHNSWISEKRNDRRFDTIYTNLKANILKEKMMNIVNIKKGY